MSARSSAEAVELYRRVRQRLLSCITRQTLTVLSTSRSSPYESAPLPHVLALNYGDFTPVLGAERLAIKVLYHYEIIRPDSSAGRWTVRTVEYSYSLARLSSASPEEIVTYHWQPGVPSGIDFPHLHVGPSIAGTSLQLGYRYAHRIHFPTGIVPLAAVIRLAIEEFGVRPLRDDWEQVLIQEQTSA